MNKTRHLFCSGKLVPALIAFVSLQLFSCSKEPLMEQPIDLGGEDEVITAAATADNLIYKETCDGSLVFNTYVSKQSATSYGLTISSAHAYSGSKAARFELRASDPETNGGTRSEISFPVTTNLNRWYSYS